MDPEAWSVDWNAKPQLEDFQGAYPGIECEKERSANAVAARQQVPIAPRGHPRAGAWLLNLDNGDTASSIFEESYSI